MSEISKVDHVRLDATWKAVDHEGAEQAMTFLHDYLIKMKEAVILTHKVEGSAYPESARGSNFDRRRIAFNELLASFHDWAECMELDKINL